MKTLILFRHGEAESYHADGDRGRRLTQRGHAQAREMAQGIAAQGDTPRLVVDSGATRARQTADELTRHWGADKIARQTTEWLYDPYPVERIDELVQSLPDTAAVAAIVGHNPEIALAANRLSARFDAHFPPCANLTLTFEVDRWADARAGEGTLKDFKTPTV